MRTVLHILTSPPDELASVLMKEQAAQPDIQVEVVRLDGGTPDYDALVTAIFRADSVVVS
jgi:hypothetical protein